MASLTDFGFPFNSVGGDRQYNATVWRSYFSKLFANGVINGFADELQVTQMTVPEKKVLVSLGAIMINGAVREVGTEKELSFADNTSGSVRRDRVVAKFDTTTRTVEFIVKQGTATAPTLTRTSNIYELSLARVELPNGYSTITDAIIVDERTEEAVCGFSKSVGQVEFERENNLLQYDREVVIFDALGDPIEIDYKLKGTAIVFMKRIYSNPDAFGRYQTITEQYFDNEELYKTYTYTLTYLATGLVNTMTRGVVFA